MQKLISSQVQPSPTLIEKATVEPVGIRAVPKEDTPRPFWAVMIPTYNPPADYFEQTLRSVVAQEGIPGSMQIEVVDDCSPDVDVGAMVKSIAGERVRFSKTPRNLGLAGCWNTCIERARGQWVHILHQDDWVLPEFYKRFEELIQASPEITAACCRHLMTDADGHWNRISVLEKRTAGVLEDFEEIISTGQRLQCACVIVKRSTYELVGGYRTDIPYVLDWEMWCRIAARGCWGYVPQPGAAYRQHLQSETNRLRRAGKTLRDLWEGGHKARSNFSSELQLRTERAFLNDFANYVLYDAILLFVQGESKEAERVLDSFRREIIKSDRRMDWLRLRLRALIKSWRTHFSHA